MFCPRIIIWGKNMEEQSLTDHCAVEYKTKIEWALYLLFSHPTEATSSDFNIVYSSIKYYCSNMIWWF